MRCDCQYVQLEMIILVMDDDGHGCGGCVSSFLCSARDGESENLEGKLTSHKIWVVFTESQKTPSYFVRRLPVE